MYGWHPHQSQQTQIGKGQLGLLSLRHQQAFAQEDLKFLRG